MIHVNRTKFMSIFNLFPLFVCSSKQHLISHIVKLSANTRSYAHIMHLSMQQYRPLKAVQSRPAIADTKMANMKIF